VAHQTPNCRQVGSLTRKKAIAGSGPTQRGVRHSSPRAARLQARSGGASGCVNTTGTAGAAGHGTARRHARAPSPGASARPPGHPARQRGAFGSGQLPLADRQPPCRPWRACSLQKTASRRACSACAWCARSSRASDSRTKFTGAYLCLHGLRHQHTARSEWTHTPGQSEQSASIAPGSSVDIRHTASLDAHCSRARLRSWPLSAPC